MDRSQITVLIIAQNEQRHISEAVKNAREIGAVLVVDGGSTDHTVELARREGATVLARPFDYAARQYNWGLQQVKTAWCLILDADERLGDELVSAIRAIDPGSRTAAFKVSRRNFFLGKPIMSSGWFPDYNVRLMRPDKVKYEDRRVHARVSVAGDTKTVHGSLDHLTYETVTQYISKLNSYTSFEVTARAGHQNRLDGRSRARGVFLRLPARPLLRFIYMFIIRRGFSEGRRGFDLAMLSAFYEWVVNLKRHYDLTDGRADPKGE